MTDQINATDRKNGYPTYSVVGLRHPYSEVFALSQNEHVRILIHPRPVSSSISVNREKGAGCARQFEV